VKPSFEFHFDDSGLKRIQRNLKSLDGENSVPIKELMPDSFIQQNTEFTSFENLLESSGFKVEELKDKGFSDFIASHTKFGDWQEMLDAAAARYVKRRLES
jgi:hypothetical protein